MKKLNMFITPRQKLIYRYFQTNKLIIRCKYIDQVKSLMNIFGPLKFSCDYRSIEELVDANSNDYIYLNINNSSEAMAFIPRFKIIHGINPDAARKKAEKRPTISLISYDTFMYIYDTFKFDRLGFFEFREKNFVTKFLNYDSKICIKFAKRDNIGLIKIRNLFYHFSEYNKLGSPIYCEDPKTNIIMVSYNKNTFDSDEYDKDIEFITFEFLDEFIMDYHFNDKLFNE